MKLPSIPMLSLGKLLPHATVILLAAVVLPRILWFAYLGGELPEPVRDQSLYIHVAGRMAQGEGLSFSRELGIAKNLRNDPNGAQGIWTRDPEYMFGITPVETPSAVMEPGYPMLLAFFFRQFGPVAGSVFVLNVLFALLGCFSASKLAGDAWGDSAGLMAGVLWALYPPYVYYSGYAMTEMAHSAMLMLSMALLFSAGRGKGTGFSAGFATGVFFLIRATAVFLLPLEIAWLAWRRKWKTILFILPGFAVAVSPWVIRNSIEMGEPVFMPTKGSLNLWMRNNPEILALEGIVIPEDMQVNSPELLEYPASDSLSGELERSAALGESATEFMIDNPRLIAWLALQRAGDFLAPGGDTLGRRGTVGGLLFYPLLLFGSIGLWRKRKSPESLFLISVFFLYLLMHAAAHGGVRYRLPVDSVFLIGIALGGCCGRSGSCTA